ncbi:MAG: ParA family protein, partial [Planctomycetes bacterium]|nr:ParA family protein [Planctomycetota bacterium]
KYAFWNNKGGTGKTSLAFQAAAVYAEQHSDERVLVLDLCPQANLSELFLGGLMGGGGANLSKLQSETPRLTVGGYFEARLPTPYTVPDISPVDFLCQPSDYNSAISENVTLLAGDPLLELQSNAIASLSNAQIPGQTPWLAVADWIKDFIDIASDDFDIVFIDTNPSFSMYTQIALSAASMLVLPVMADDSSRRAIQNAFALIHGLKLPSSIYSDYSFTKKLTDAGRSLPQVHLMPKNRLTQYMGPASAYLSVMGKIEAFVSDVLTTNPEVFTFSDIADGFVDVRDFQTTGVVAFAEGKPFTKLKTGKHDIGGRETQVNGVKLRECQEAIQDVVNRL